MAFFDPTIEKSLRDAALARLSQRAATQGTKSSKSGGQGALAGGIVGAILGAYAGNPMAGYALGSQLGSAAGRGNLDLETGVQLAPSVLSFFGGGGGAAAPAGK